MPLRETATNEKTLSQAPPPFLARPAIAKPLSPIRSLIIACYPGCLF
jgi:hypothetical protein